MATIGALSKGVVSERKRIRAPGRPWLNLCRDEVEKKRVSIEHVSSHTGSETPEQKGNDAADALANKYRLEGESAEPVPYLVSTEEPIILEFHGSNVQGDPRNFLKQMAKEKMADVWRTKPKQSEWFVKHPTQVLKQAKLVWKWATESGAGRAWLYFIFGICQWLPTNYRINYEKSDEMKRCSLCLSRTMETMDHLLCCPALMEEHVHLRQVVKSKLEYWQIPFSNLPFVSREHGLRIKWKAAAREKFSSEAVSSTQLDTLTHGFWKTNQTKQFISTRNFLESLSSVMENRMTSPHVSSLPRNDLLSILIHELSLQTQGFTDSLHFSPLFENWTSVNAVDVSFGAKLWTDPKMHHGGNVFFFHGPKDRVNTQGLLEVLSESLASNLPTRFVCLVPSQDKLPSHFLELATLHPGSPLSGVGDEGCYSECSMSIILAANKESLQIDPINWEKFIDKLHDLLNDYISIPNLTDALFRERITLPHPPRSLSKQPLNVILKSSSLINFYDAFAPTERSQNTVGKTYFPIEPTSSLP